MIEKIINKNIIFLQKYGVNMETEDDKDVYKYGLRILYYYIIDIGIILSISALFNKLYESAIILFIFALFQIFGGGYHAKTKLKCTSLMIIGVITGNILINIILNYKIFMIISVIILSIVIFIIGPVTNKKHPVSKKTYKRSKLIARIVVLANIFTMVLLLKINRDIEAAAIVSTIYLYTISLITAKIKIFNAHLR